MSKLILALAAIAAFSAPALAGRLDVDLPAANGAAQIGKTTYGDLVSTRSATAVKKGRNAAEIAAERNKHLFGASGR